ncbi:MAG: HAD family hydrolase [Chloroflexi bacterium HGW-Chloroflexi-3]|nr:MAG: HAD family hydrolase [Chloroflexi bacterium HGW-Chloroflexi-3]
MTQAPHEILSGIKAFVLDLDGTVFLSDRLLPGAIELVDYLKHSNIPFLFFTNNSSKHRGLYADKLNRLGLDVDENLIFTSGEATALFLREHFPHMQRIDLYGTPALEEEFMGHGFTLVTEHPQALVLGFDTTLTYAKLWRLCDGVRAGIPYFATHPDINCPLENGVMPDIGAMIAFVAASTGRNPDYVIGKPNPPVVSALMKRFRLRADQICMVGDRLYTDIALGQAGLRTVLVLSGETNKKDVPLSPFQPDLVVKNLKHLYTIIKNS